MTSNLDLYGGLRDLGSYWLKGLELRDRRREAKADMEQKQKELEAKIASEQRRNDLDERGQNLTAAANERSARINQAKTYADLMQNNISAMQYTTNLEPLMNQAKNYGALSSELLGSDPKEIIDSIQNYANLNKQTGNEVVDYISEHPELHDKVDQISQSKVDQGIDPAVAHLAAVTEVLPAEFRNRAFNPTIDTATGQPKETQPSIQPSAQTPTSKISFNGLEFDLTINGKERKMFAPLSGANRVTSKFGETRNVGTSPHLGLDLAVTPGESVGAMSIGKVIKTGEDAKSGKYIIYMDKSGNTVSYSHLDSIDVKPGDILDPYKQNGIHIVGKAGNTGETTGPNLHIRVKNKDGKDIDPQKYMSGALTSVPKTQVAISSFDPIVGGLDSLKEQYNNQLAQENAKQFPSKAVIDYLTSEISDIDQKKADVLQKIDKENQDAQEKEAARLLNERRLNETSRHNLAAEATAGRNAAANETRASNSSKSSTASGLKGSEAAANDYAKKVYPPYKPLASNAKEYLKLRNLGGTSMPDGKPLPKSYTNYINGLEARNKARLKKGREEYWNTPEGKSRRSGQSVSTTSSLVTYE